MIIILCITKKAKALVFFTKHAQCASDPKKRQLERQELCNVSICLNTMVRLKVGISSGQNVKGCKQTGAGGVTGIHVCFLKGVSKSAFSVAAQRLTLSVGKRSEKSPSLSDPVF